MRLLASTAIIVFVVDQVLKWYVVHVLNLVQRLRIDVFPPYLNLRMAWNEGINFGLGEGTSRWVLIGVALAIVGLVLFWIRKETHLKWVMISAGLLVGGAFGNIVDRLLHGAVADFLNMSCCGIDNPFAFNVADIMIFVGAVGLVFLSGRETSGVTKAARRVKK